MMKYEDWATKHLEIKSLSFDEANVVCPLHEDHSPSMRFNLNTGLWICHGCHEAGNVSMLSTRLGVGGPGEAATTVVELEAELEALIDEHENLSGEYRWLDDGWLGQFQVSLKKIKKFWVLKRQLSMETVDKFSLGWEDSTKAAIIPIRTDFGALYGVIRRFTDPKSKLKYLNPTGFKRAESLLFLNYVDSSTVAVVEGPIDALKCWDAGVPAVALYGSSMSEQQAELLRRHGVSAVVSFMDNDPAGKLGTMKIDKALSGVVHYAVEWPDQFRGFDPGSLRPRHIRGLYAQAIPFHRWNP